MKSTRFSHRTGRARRLSWLVVAGLTTAALVGPGAGAASADPLWATVTGYAAGSAANNNPDNWGDDCTKLDDPQVNTYTLGANYALVIVKAGSESSAPGHVNTLFANASMGETVWADSNGSGAYDNGDKGISHIIFCGPRETTTTSTETTSTETTSTDTTSTETTSTETTSTATTSTETTSTETTSTETTSTETTSTDTTSTEPTPTPTPDPTPTPTPTPTPDPTRPTPTPNPTPTPTPDPTPTPTPEATPPPTGEVLSEVGVPAVTLPPTDTLTQSSSAPAGDNWRLILLAMAGILAGSLVLTPGEVRAKGKGR